MAGWTDAATVAPRIRRSDLPRDESRGSPGENLSDVRGVSH